MKHPRRSAMPITDMCPIYAVCAVVASVSIRKIPPAPRSVPLVFLLAGRARRERGIVHPAELWTGQRAARAAFPSGDLPGPEPARNGGRRLFSAAGEEPALHREAK